MKGQVAASALLAILLSANDAVAQAAAGNAVAGRALTLQFCSECHATQKGQLRSPNSRSPTFVELANVPGMTEAALTVALTTPHAGMPMFLMSADQRANVIAITL
jgi:mono/diheme cytochrome c family protein